MPVIRDARAEEIDGTAALLIAAYQEHLPAVTAALTPAARAVWEGYRQDIGNVRSRLPHSHLIVAVEGDRVLGSVTFYPRAGALVRYPELPESWAGFRLLGVHPEARGLGLGRRLTLECIRRAREARAPSLGLHTAGLMAVARAMYLRMGFRHAPEHDFSPTPGFVVEGYRMDL
jgi:ribosomal protein S18 acetylase RimI-like enzyme